MRTTLLLAGACALLLSVSAAPAPAPEPNPAPGPDPAPAAAAIDDNTPEIIEIIAPAASAQETLSTLNLGAPGAELSDRNKRTIGILRQLFPTLTQELPEQQQNLLSGAESQQAEVRVAFGDQQQPAEPRTDDDQQTAAQTNNAAIDEITLDDADNSEENRNKRFLSFGGSSGGQSSGAGGGSGNFLFDVVRRPAEAMARAAGTAFRLFAGTDSLNLGLTASHSATLDSSQELPEQQQNLLSGAESQQAEVRVAFGDQQQPAEPRTDDDQQTAAQTNNAAIDEITLDDADNSEENRNKRFLSFGGSSGGQSSGAGGGSGNFLFDVVRRPAEAMARAAGTAFRLFAGTDSLNLGLTASHSATLDSSQLVAGSSGGSSGGGEAVGGSDSDSDDGAAKGDNLTEGVPGPITRLFIIANRGIANLVQDLILRLAQTSERIVNFKARLITSII